MNIVKMNELHREAVLEMVIGFYHSSAVDHEVEAFILERTFNDAVSDCPLIEGYVIIEDEKAVGFAYITEFYACEVGGSCVMIEEIYLNAGCRGKGYGAKFMKYIFDKYSHAKRFRLEVTKSNQAAVRLYEKLGFNFIAYEQMAKDL